LRVLICTNDGYVLQDVQTFCRDPRNNRVGNNNNYCVQFLDFQVSPSFPQTVTLNPSGIDLTDQKKPLQQLNVVKCQSNIVPSSVENKLEYKIVDSNGNLIKEETNNSFVNRQLLDNHLTRTEIILSKISKYGFSSRRSDTTNNFNWYVARNVDDTILQNKGTSFTLRVSFFEW
jgi:hypothetical protein